MTDVLPCDYYRVLFKLGSGEDASTVLYSSMMEVVHGDVPSYVAEGEVVNDDFVSQLKCFAPKKCYQRMTAPVVIHLQTRHIHLHNHSVLSTLEHQAGSTHVQNRKRSVRSRHHTC